MCTTPAFTHNKINNVYAGNVPNKRNTTYSIRSPASTAFAKSSYARKKKQQENTYFWVCTLFFE